MTWKTLTRTALIQSLAQQPSSFRLLDIRSKEQFDSVHITGSQHYDCLSLRCFAEQTASDIPIVLICRRGRTSCHAAAWFDQLGFSAVYSLEDGIEGMQQHAPEWLTGAKGACFKTPREESC